MLHNSGDVSLHEPFHLTSSFVAPDEAWDPGARLGPDESVSAHSHVVLLGEIDNGITRLEVKVGFALRNHFHLAN